MWQPSRMIGRIATRSLAINQCTLVVILMMMLTMSMNMVIMVVMAQTIPNCAAGQPPDRSSIHGGEIMCSGHDHTCVITEGGSVACWGIDTYGQVSPKFDSIYSSVSCGNYHSCALTIDGSIDCWGYPIENVLVPPQVSSKWAAVSSGLYHSCGITVDGEIYCWGQNTYGQSSPPTCDTFALCDQWVQADGGETHTCGLLSTGSVVCWGDDQYGQVSNAPSGNTYTMVTAGKYWSCALNTTGAVTCWGKSISESDSTSPGPASLGPAASGFVTMNGNDEHACGLLATGAISCWREKFPDTCVTVGAGYRYFCPREGSYAAVSAGYHFSCAMYTNRTVVCWAYQGSGTNPHNNLLTYETDAAMSQSSILGALAWTTQTTNAVSAGVGQHVCVARVAAGVICRGANNINGQLTPPDTTTVYSQVSAGTTHSCGIRASGSQVDCWGETVGTRVSSLASTANTATDWLWADTLTYSMITTANAITCGVLGTSTPGAIRCVGKGAVNTEISGEGKTYFRNNAIWSRVAIGNTFVCGLNSTGGVLCLGDSRLPIVPQRLYTSMCAGFGFVCAILKSSSTITCWGYSLLDATIPSGSFIDLSCSASDVCARSASGFLKCWGNTPSVRSPPALSFTSYSVGAGTACGQSTSFPGDVICWGERAQIIGVLPPTCSSSRSISMSPSGSDGSWCGTTGFTACASLSFILSSRELSRPYSIIEPLPGRYNEGTGLLDRGAVRMSSVGQMIRLPYVYRTNGGNEVVFDCAAGTCLLLSHWSVRLEYVTFTGGAPAVEVDFDLRRLSLTNITFRSNIGRASQLSGAGGLYVQAGSVVTCYLCNFITNIGGDGGAIYASFATLMLQSCTFTSNVAMISGGAIFAYSTTLTITSTTFTNNTAVTGGAIAAEHGWISCASSIFTNNNGINGGAISLTKVTRDNNVNGLIPVITSGSLASNYAQTGGALSLSETDLSLVGVTFSDNHATAYLQSGGDGGAISMIDSFVNTTQCQYNYNTIIRSSVYGWGGAAIACSISRQASTRHSLLANFCVFNGNYAPGSDGGALNSLNCDMSLFKSTFTNNMATKGGAVFANGGSGTIMGSGSDSIFDSNSAVDNTTAGRGQGGVIYAYDSIWSIGGSILRNNRATGGGAVYYVDNPIPITESSVNTYSNNQSPYANGAQQGGSASSLVLLHRPPISGSLPSIAFGTNSSNQFDFQLLDRWAQPLLGDNTTLIVASVNGGNRSTLTGAIAIPYTRGRATFESLGLLAIAGTTINITFTSSFELYDGTPIVLTNQQPVTIRSCPSGTYNELTSLTCPACPGGQFSGENAIGGCELCAKGKYAADSGTSICSDCPIGRVAAQTGQKFCDLCGPGTEPSADGTQCTPCSQGYASESGEKCLPCLAGSATPSIGQGQCQICEVGTYSAANASSICLPCLAGTSQSESGATSCNNCTAGRYNPSSRQQSCPFCPIGRYSVNNNSIDCVNCPAGRAQQLQGQTMCYNCSVGKYTEASGQQYCTLCNIGSYTNENGSLSCQSCPIGRYQQSTGSSECGACPLGRSSRAVGQQLCDACQNGLYANVTGQDCQACPSGRYAPPNANGTIDCLLCPPGYANEATGQQFCTPCANGKFSNGYGAITCADCPVGEYQPNGTSTECIKCAVGTSSSAKGQVSCIACNNGFYSPVSGSPCLQCSPGNYSIDNAGGVTVCEICAVGRANPSYGQPKCQDCSFGQFANVTGLTGCTSCSEGKYQASLGKSVCNDCEIGKSSSGLGQVTCIPCHAGLYSASAGLPCGMCQPGEYSPRNDSINGVGGGITKCSQCEPGKYSNAQGQQSCIECGAGRYTNSSGTIECKVCPEGKYMKGTGATVCNDCPLGTSSTDVGQIECFSCQKGTYNPVAGVRCISCSRGTYTGEGQFTVCSDCSPGTATNEEGQSSCTPCPKGSYSDSNRTDVCTPCAVGRYQDSNGQTSCVPCLTGRYTSAIGQTVCLPCEQGAYSNTTGLSMCRLCDTGTYSPNSTATACIECEYGKYSFLTGSATCRDCPQGRFSNVTGLTECNECDIGQSQSSVGRSICDACSIATSQNVRGQPQCNLCGQGKYAAVTGLSECVACPQGRSTRGTDGAAECQLCDVGKATNDTGLTSCSTCTGATVAPYVGTVTCRPCPLFAGAADRSQTVCSCLDGYYKMTLPTWTDSDDLFFGFRCAACPSGADGCKADVVQVPASRWLYRTTTNVSGELVLSSVPQIVPCPPGACAENGQCASGRINSYDNILCGECLPGYSEWSGKCVPCDKPNGGLIFAFIVLSWLYTIVTHLVSQSTTGLSKIFFFFLQTALFMTGPAEGPLSWMGLANFNPQDSTGSTCIFPLDPYQKMALHIFGPLIFIGELWVTAGLQRIYIWYRKRQLNDGIRSRAETTFPRDAYIRSTLALFVFSYTQVSSSTLRYLHCIDVGPHRVLYIAPAIDCASEKYHQYMVMPVIVLVFDILLAPAVIGYFLSQNVEKMYPRQSFGATWGVLFEPYQKSAYWWEVVALYRRTLFVIFDIILFQSPQWRSAAFVFLCMILLSSHTFLQPFRDPFENLLEQISLCLLVIISVILTADSAPFSLTGRVLLSIMVVVPSVLFAVYFVTTRVILIHAKMTLPKSGRERSARATELTQPGGVGVLPTRAISHGSSRSSLGLGLDGDMPMAMSMSMDGTSPTLASSSGGHSPLGSSPPPSDSNGRHGNGSSRFVAGSLELTNYAVRQGHGDGDNDGNGNTRASGIALTNNSLASDAMNMDDIRPIDSPQP